VDLEVAVIGTPVAEQRADREGNQGVIGSRSELQVPRPIGSLQGAGHIA